MRKLVKCMICGKELHDVGFGGHLKKHNMKISEYYDKYLKTDPLEGICKVCGKPTTFRGIDFGYSEYHISCVAKDPNVHKKKKDNFLELPVEEQIRKRESKLRKYKETSLEKYGKDNYSKTEEFKSKSEQTCLERYGVTHWGKLLTGKTLIESYGIEKAKSISLNISKSTTGLKRPFKKRNLSSETIEILRNYRLNKTYEEIYGAERSKEIRIKLQGPSNILWSRDSDYTDKFFDFSYRLKILQDQNFLCASCGKCLKGSRVKKNLHHINFVKSDDRRENLIYLCVSCHSKTQNRTTYESTMKFLNDRNTFIILESRERKANNVRNKKIKN